VDAFRHAIERMDPAEYLATGYYGRWMAALERLLVEARVLGPGEIEARLRGAPPGIEAAAKKSPAPRAPGGAQSSCGAEAGVIRTVENSPRFAVAQAVRARNIHPEGHTRLPRYVRGRRGIVDRVHPACVFPDTHAHGRGENPQYVYSVRFTARELWGEDAEPGASVCLDLFEDYLEEDSSPLAARRSP
jgi:nitrile hydratase beta subunit